MLTQQRMTEYFRLPVGEWAVSDFTSMFPDAPVRLLADIPADADARAFSREIIEAAAHTGPVLTAAIVASAGAKPAQELAALVLSDATDEELLAAGRQYIVGGRIPTAKAAIKVFDRAAAIVGCSRAAALYEALAVHWDSATRDHANEKLAAAGKSEQDLWRGSSLSPKAARMLLRLGTPGVAPGGTFFERFRPHHAALHDLGSGMVFQLESLDTERGILGLGLNDTEFFIGLRAFEGDPMLICGELASADLDTNAFPLSALGKQASVYDRASDDAGHVAVSLLGPAQLRLKATVAIAGVLGIDEAAALATFTVFEGDPSGLDRVPRAAASAVCDAVRPEGFAGILRPERATSFSVELETVGPSKVKVVRVLKDALALGSKEALTLMKAVPVLVAENRGVEDTLELVLSLRRVGAEASICPSESAAAR